MASSHPIQVEVFSADEVSEIFDAISYVRLHCLVQLLLYNFRQVLLTSVVVVHCTVYGPICSSIGWEKQEGEPHTDSLKRSLVLKAIAAADDEDTKKVAAEKFELLKADTNAAVDPDLKLLVYSLAAANGEHDTLVSMMNDPATMSEERVRLLQSLGSTKDEATMEKILGMLLDDESGVRSQDAMYCMAVGAVL